MKIKFAIVGCGHIAQRHAQHINNHPQAKLIGAHDIVWEQTQKIAEKYDCQAFANINDLLASDVDIVNVCTPNGDHHITAVKVLEAQKHCLVEKPMSIRKEFGEQMINAALNNGKNLFVVKQNRFNPPVQADKKLQEQGKLGKILSVVVNGYWNRNERYYQQSEWRGTKHLDGGTLFTQFSHFVDILYYLFGDAIILSSVLKNAQHQNLIEFEDTGHFLFQLKKDKAIGSFNYTTNSYAQNMEGSICIFAENATIKIGGQYLNTIDYQSTNGFDIELEEKSNTTNNPNDYGFYQGSMSNHDKVIDNVVKSLLGEEKIMTNAYDGLKVVEIIENVYKCSSQSITTAPNNF